MRLLIRGEILFSLIIPRAPVFIPAPVPFSIYPVHNSIGSDRVIRNGLFLVLFEEFFGTGVQRYGHSISGGRELYVRAFLVRCREAFAVGI